jgi:hypothetical protein
MASALKSVRRQRIGKASSSYAPLKA